MGKKISLKHFLELKKKFKKNKKKIVITNGCYDFWNGEHRTGRRMESVNSTGGDVCTETYS